jgi:hypothetical protein
VQSEIALQLFILTCSVSEETGGFSTTPCPSYQA